MKAGVGEGQVEHGAWHPGKTGSEPRTGLQVLVTLALSLPALPPLTSGRGLLAPNRLFFLPSLPFLSSLPYLEKQKEEGGEETLLKVCKPPWVIWIKVARERQVLSLLFCFQLYK